MLQGSLGMLCSTSEVHSCLGVPCVIPHPSLHSEGEHGEALLSNPPTYFPVYSVFPPGYPTWQEGGGQHMSQSWDSGSRVRSYICQNSGEARFKKISGLKFSKWKIHTIQKTQPSGKKCNTTLRCLKETTEPPKQRPHTRMCR